MFSMDEAAEQDLFDILKGLADHYGWDLSKRDPGPELDTVNDVWPRECEDPKYWIEGTADYCEIDTGWCYTHNKWIDEHNWALPPDPKATWSEAEIRAATDELRSL